MEQPRVEAATNWPLPSEFDETHYGVLELSDGANATVADIRKAYRRLARLHHPDKGGGTQRFARLQAAAAVLLDPKQRAAYHDQIRASQFVPGPIRSQPDPEEPGHSDHQPTTLEEVWESDEEEGLGTEQHEKQEAAAPANQGASGALEGALLDVLAAQGMQCNASTQLVVTCELCRLPATRRCWVCTCDLCEMCTRSMHAKGEWGLHWPLVNAPGSLSKQLAVKEFEQKRLEDAQIYEAAQPGFLPQARRMVIRDFHDAVRRAAQRPGSQREYTPALAQHYMWAQTDGAVHIAVHMPEGVADRQARVELEGRVLRVWTDTTEPEPSNDTDQGQSTSNPTQLLGQGEDNMSSGQAADSSEQRGQALGPVRRGAELPVARCVVDRQLAGTVDTSLPLKVMRTLDNRFLVLVLAKAIPSRPWRHLFTGDSDGARCVAGGEPGLYRMLEDDSEVVIEMDFPNWVRSDDVRCTVDALGMTVSVPGLVEMQRTFWKPSGQADQDVVDVDKCGWSLTSSPTSGHLPSSAAHCNDASASQPTAQPSRKPGKVLTVQLVKRQVTLQEMQYKHGVRQDHLVAERPDGGRGVAFFSEDEDTWNLTPLLQASVFQEAGSVYIATLPGRSREGSAGRWAHCLGDLPQEVAKLVQANGSSTAEQSSVS